MGLGFDDNNNNSPKQKTTKPHVVCVPYPSQGHINPMMQLAKLLHSRGFHITFVNTEFNHARLVRSSSGPAGPTLLEGLPDFRFEAIPEGLPPSGRGDATQDVPALCEATRQNCLAPFRKLLRKLNGSEVEPKVSCVVSDGVMGFGREAGRELGVPQVQFWTASVCSFVGYLHYDELLRRGIVPFKDEKFLEDGTLDTPIDWIPGMKNVRLKDLPSFIRTQSIDDIMFDFMGSEARKCLNSSAIIFNTFDAFEPETLRAISAKFPNIYPIGPLQLLERHIPGNEFSSHSTSLWREDSSCLEWLDTRDSKSVVYVNYGSVTTMSDRHFVEFAWGLAESNHSFLWIVRPDVVEGSDSASLLPDEFFEEVKDRGLIASWCSQRKVLEHPSVACFLSHCGWNSMMETVGAGVPVIGWPFFADQQTNCRYACVNWGTGCEVNGDVKRDELAELVKEMMESENGKRKREKALEWKRKAFEATEIGGSSYNSFDRFINEMVTLMDK